MQEFYKTRGGTRFDRQTGKLYLFGPGSVEVRRAWPVMLAWRKTIENPAWAHVRPDIAVMTGPLKTSKTEPVPIRDVLRELQACLREGGADESGLFDSMRISRADAMREWNAAIPEDVREVVSRFPKRQWHLLSLIACCGNAAMDLAQSNQALAFMLASNWVFHKPAVKKPMRSARALLGRGKKQREILGWLGFPATGSARKALRKAATEVLDVTPLMYLRDALHNPPAARLLAHVTQINVNVLRLVTNPGLLPFVSPAFLEDVCQQQLERWEQGPQSLLRDTLEMLRMQGPEPNNFAPRSVEELRAVHDELVDDADWYEIGWESEPFPPPPLAGNDCIVPIQTWHEIVREGEQQRNCVASYVGRVVKDRSTYIYRVVYPERCTLSIVRSGGSWKLGELLTARNRPAQPFTFYAVLDWLDRHQRPPRVECPFQLRLDFPQ